MNNNYDFSAFEGTCTDISEHINVNNYDIPMNTPKQRAFIHGLLDKVNMSESDLFWELDFDVDSLKDLTLKQASEAIEYLKEIRGY